MTKNREVTKEVTGDGWVFHSQTGSHKHYKHPIKPGKVTIPGAPNDDLPEGTVRSIRRQAGLPPSPRSGDGKGAT